MCVAMTGNGGALRADYANVTAWERCRSSMPLDAGDAVELVPEEDAQWRSPAALGFSCNRICARRSG